MPPPAAVSATRWAAVGAKIVSMHQPSNKRRTAMNLVKWDPFRELEDVSSRLNRIFGRTPARSESDNEMLAVADWMPSVDISETDTAYLIRGEIPGVKKEDVKVTIQEG